MSTEKQGKFEEGFDQSTGGGALGKMVFWKNIHPRTSLLGTFKSVSLQLRVCVAVWREVHNIVDASCLFFWQFLSLDDMDEAKNIDMKEMETDHNLNVCMLYSVCRHSWLITVYHFVVHRNNAWSWRGSALWCEKRKWIFLFTCHCRAYGSTPQKL